MSHNQDSSFSDSPSSGIVSTISFRLHSKALHTLSKTAVVTLSSLLIFASDDELILASFRKSDFFISLSISSFQSFLITHLHFVLASQYSTTLHTVHSCNPIVSVLYDLSVFAAWRKKHFSYPSTRMTSPVAQEGVLPICSQMASRDTSLRHSMISSS